MNEKQLEAVKSLENTLVVAGAGSGKTFTIVNKIKYLLDNNIYKENELLVISFTNESVNDLKRKIDYNLDIMTFHKLAITLINNPDMKISNEYYNNHKKGLYISILNIIQGEVDPTQVHEALLKIREKE